MVGSCESAGVRKDDRFDAVIQFGGEDVVALGDVLQWNAMCDNLTRLQIAVLDV
jgi:hypothetical protein